MSDLAFTSWGLGRTFYQGNTINVANSYAQAGNPSFVGRKRVLQYIDPTATHGARVKTLQDDVVAIAVQNRSGATLLPGRIVKWSSTGTGKHVDGYTTGAEPARAAGVVDPWLPSTGVPDGDIFWLIVEGPCLVSQASTTLTGDVAVGDILFAITASSAGAPEAGRFQRFGGTFTQAQGTNGYILTLAANYIGRARSTANSNATNGLVLVDLRIR
jgi:hypothetical protein